MASYIKANKDVTLQGTKRFTDKSGEYYLKNIQLQNSRQDPNSTVKNTLNNPQNLENCLNRDINKIRRRASKIVTLLPENSLTPIPKKEGIHKTGLANKYGKKELDDAQRTAVFIRRMEYATSMKKQMNEGKNMKNNAKKIALIQEWWKTMFKIIKLQKNVRGFLFRKKLMNNLEHQEKLLQFITEFDNIHNYHLYRQFMDNLKKKRDYEKAKLMEKCEDFNEKLDNLEKLHNLKNFRNCFEKWKNDTRKKKKEDLDRLVTKLNTILRTRVNKNNLTVLKKLKDQTKSMEDRLNDKADEFRERNAKKKFLDHLIKSHRLNKILSDVKKKIDDRHKKDALDKLKRNNDIGKAAERLNKLLEDKMKKQAFDDLKTMDFVDKVDDVINKHNDKVNDDAKKEFLDKLKDMNNKNKLKDKLRQWKDFNDEMKNRNKILNKLKRYKQNELKKKAEQEKNKFAISSGVNDFELISDKKDDESPKKTPPVFSTSQNDLNFEALPQPKMVFERAGQNFSLMAPNITKFEFEDPQEKCKKADNAPLNNQLDDLDDYRRKNDLKKYMDKWKDLANKRDIMDKLKDRLNDLLKKQKQKQDKFKKVFDDLQQIKEEQDLREYFNRWRNAANQMKKDSLEDLAKKLNDILSKAKKESDDKLKKDFLDQLKRDNDIAKAVQKLDHLLNKKPKKDALDTLKKNSGMSEGFRVLDKLFKDHSDKDKKDFLDRLKKNADTQKALEDLDKLLNKKLKEKFMDNLKKCNDFKKALDKLNKVTNDNIKKNFLDKLKKLNDIHKGAQLLDKIMKKKMKKDTLDYLNKNNKVGLLTDKLEKLLRDKLKRKFLDRLKNNSKIEAACNKLKQLMDKKLKKDGFDTLKKNYNLEKAKDILDKLIKNKNDKLKKDTFDELKKNDAIAKAADKLERLMTNKLKDDTLKKLKTMQFVDILDKMKKKHDDKDKNEKLKQLMDNLKKIQNDNKELERKNKETLKKYLDRWKEIADRGKIKDALVDKARKKNAFDHWRKVKDLRDILDKLNDYLRKKKALNDWKNNMERKQILKNTKKNKTLGNTLKKMDKVMLKNYFDKWRENAKKPVNDRPKSKRISRRTNSKRKRSKSKRNNNRKLLRQAFDKWRENSSFEPTRNVLEKIKRNKLLQNNFDNLNENQKNDLLDKYKHKMMQVLLNIYKRQRNILLKRYLDKWKKAKSLENDDKIEPKYKKKPKIGENKDLTDSEENSFNPTYYNPKRNLYSQKTAPYRKRYVKRPYEPPEDLINSESETENYNQYNNINPIDKDQYSDTSSNNESAMGNGEYLIQNRKVTKQPRNYTSQSFFIDKNTANNLAKNNYQLNTHNTNQLPMTMKGDFVSLIENNPKILSQKNPRIQVTNATCDLNQIINNENTEDELNTEEVNDEIDKLNNNFVLDKNKVLSKVIKNCDKDLYASQKPFRAKKDQWYSVSIPLNDNEAKWEFLNNIKGERDKNNLNKFELIQNEGEPIKEENEVRETPHKKNRTDKKNPNRDTSYRLREMNYSQFYRSPIRTPKVEEDEQTLIGNRIRRPGDRKKTQRSFISNFSNSRNLKNNIGSNNIERSRGKIELDPKYRSIDYDNGYGEFEDSDE